MRTRFLAAPSMERRFLPVLYWNIPTSLYLIACRLEPGDFRLDELSGTSILLQVLKRKRRAKEQ